MGLVSILEDIIERIDDGLKGLEDYNSGTITTISEPSNRERNLEALVITCRQIRRQIESYLDIATDPKINLAYELEYQELHIKELQRELDKTKQQRDDLQKQLVGIVFDRNIEKARIIKLEQENHDLKEKLERQEKHEKKASAKLKRTQRSRQ